MDFSINQKVLENDVVLISVSGYLDAHTFEELEESITGLFKTRVYKIVVDLSGVEYISSAGAGVFIGALSTAQENSGNIVLLNPTANVREVFDLLGLTQIFSVVENQEQAVAALAG